MDSGGGLRYRATGKLKEHLDNEVPDLKDLHNPEFNKWAAKLFKGVEVSKHDPSYETALRIAQIPDHHISPLVGVYGPESREKNDELADTIIARRDAVARAYGIKKEEYQEGAGRATIAFHEFESGGAFDC